MTESSLIKVEIDIDRPAALCYLLMCDALRVPEWVGGVADVRVLAHDEDGRIARAEFLGMPSRASVTYEVHYTYDDAGYHVRWYSVDQDVRAFAGEARFVAIDDGRCRMEYGVVSEAGTQIPDWAHEALLESGADVAASFQRFAQRQTRT